jgi:hypothetical protein
MARYARLPRRYSNKGSFLGRFGELAGMMLPSFCGHGTSFCHLREFARLQMLDFLFLYDKGRIRRSLREI